MIKKTKVAILISGRGSNMQAIVRASEATDFPVEVVLVLANKIDAEGLQFAQEKKIKTAFVSHCEFSSRQDFDKKVSEEIEKSGAEIVCLAGFMRLLSGWFVTRCVPWTACRAAIGYAFSGCTSWHSDLFRQG